MNALLTNWKTTATAAAIIVLGLLKTVLGVEVPGFNMDLGAALTMAIGLFFAKDSNVTGGTVKQ